MALGDYTKTVWMSGDVITSIKLNNNEDKTKELDTELLSHKAESSTETVKGHVELATAAETTTGTDNTRAVHPAGVKVELDKKLNLAGGTMTGKLLITKNIGLTPTYLSGQVELQSTNGDDVLLGFHRGGATACALTHKDNISGLHLIGTSDVLADFRAGKILSNSNRAITTDGDTALQLRDNAGTLEKSTDGGTVWESVGTDWSKYTPLFGEDGSLTVTTNTWTEVLSITGKGFLTRAVTTFGLSTVRIRVYVDGVLTLDAGKGLILSTELFADANSKVGSRVQANETLSTLGTSYQEYPYTLGGNVAVMIPSPIFFESSLVIQVIDTSSTDAPYGYMGGVE